jgi:hypothetical protein
MQTLCEEQRQKIAALIVEAIWRQKAKIAAQQSAAIEMPNVAKSNTSINTPEVSNES